MTLKRDHKLTVMIDQNLLRMLEILARDDATVSACVRRLIRAEFERRMPKTEETKNVYKLVERLDDALLPIEREAADIEPVITAINELGFAIDNWKDSLRAKDIRASSRRP